MNLSSEIMALADVYKSAEVDQAFEPFSRQLIDATSSARAALEARAKMADDVIHAAQAYLHQRTTEARDQLERAIARATA